LAWQIFNLISELLLWKLVIVFRTKNQTRQCKMQYTKDPFEFFYFPYAPTTPLRPRSPHSGGGVVVLGGGLITRASLGPPSSRKSMIAGHAQPYCFFSPYTTPSIYIRPMTFLNSTRHVILPEICFFRAVGCTRTNSTP